MYKKTWSFSKNIQDVCSSESFLSVMPCFQTQVIGKKWTAKDCVPAKKDYSNRKVVKGTKSTFITRTRGPAAPPVMQQRRDYLTRGLAYGEIAELQHKQFGIIALKGGLIKFSNFHNVHMKINTFLKKRPQLLATWRVESPHHAVTMHPIQAVMGGGKGKINYYVTPIRARQVLLEMHGKMEFIEVYRILKQAALHFPFPAMAVDYHMLQDMYEEERRLEDENENFFTFREVIEKNMRGMRTCLSQNDFKLFGKLR